MQRHALRPGFDAERQSQTVFRAGGMGGDNLDIAGEVRRAISQSDRIVIGRNPREAVVASPGGVDAKDGCSRSNKRSGVSIHSLTVNGDDYEFARKFSPQKARSA